MKNEWVIPLKYKKGETTTKAFQKILDESCHKPRKIWLDGGSEFYIRSMKSWLEHNNNEDHSTHKKIKKIITERFVRNPNNKINNSMISLLNIVYILINFRK